MEVGRGTEVSTRGHGCSRLQMSSSGDIGSHVGFFTFPPSVHIKMVFEQMVSNIHKEQKEVQ